MSANVPIRYHFLAYRREQLWLPAGLWGLFCILAVMFRSEPRAVDVAGGFLGIVLPLMAGVLATSVLVDDPAIELQLTAARPPWRTLIERLGLLLSVIVVAALTYQVVLIALGVDVSALGTVASRQLVWLAPSLTMMGLGSVAALAFAQGTTGVLFVGGIWITQVLLRGWFLSDPWARYVFLFTGNLAPDSPVLAANQACLIGLAAGFIVIASLLLRKEERYI